MNLMESYFKSYRIPLTMVQLKALYEKLLEHFGEQDWWPGETRFEVMVGAILTQNVSWTNVEMAIDNLKADSVLNPAGIINIDKERLEDLIRPTGFYSQKADRLKRLAREIESRGGLDEFLEEEDLRSVLLDIKGIGQETADSIALYSAHRPQFVVDAYTRRILKRMYDVEGNYQKIKSIFEEEMKESVSLYKEYHALLVELGKNYCKKDPSCEKCPVSVGCAHEDVTDG